MDKSLSSLLSERFFRYKPSTLSTMDDVRDWLQSEGTLPSGAVVIADEQRGGKGRLGRQWLTPPETAIAMSVYLRADYLEPYDVPMLGGLSVLESLRPLTAASVSLKYPNDVLLAGKKVCGVLAEGIWSGDALTGMILGIGVNISVDFSNSELAEKATSLADHAATKIDRAALIASILKRVDYWTDAAQTPRRPEISPIAPPSLYESWKAELDTLGKQITLQNGDEQVHGLALDVTPQGGLIIQTSDGQKRYFLAGDVSLSPSAQ